MMFFQSRSIDILLFLHKTYVVGTIRSALAGTSNEPHAVGVVRRCGVSYVTGVSN